MRHIKILGLSCLAVFAFSAIAAVAAQAASAPHWRVEKTNLAKGKEKEFTATSTTAVTLKGGGVNLTSPIGKCSSSGKVIGSEAGEPGTVTGATLTCTEVTIEGASEVCTVHSTGQANGTVKTTTLSGTLVWLNETGGEAGMKFTPSSGTEFTTIIIEGAECSVKNPGLKVTGEEIGKLAPVEQEVASGTMSFPATPILNWWNNAEPRVKQTISQLKLGESKAIFAGIFSIALTSGEKVGVFPG
jgi:hypothetical protein